MKREDGRKPEDMRPIVAKAGVIPNANGSAIFSFGKTTAIAAVYGPRIMHPKRLQLANKATLHTIYSLLPFSTTDRNRPGPSRRSQEISKVIRDALAPAIFLEEYPKATIDVYIDILEADSGTRTAGINAASIALADAGISMRGLVSAVAAGKIGNDAVLDLAGKEEDESVCDLPVAYLSKEKKITLMQLDGDLSSEDLKGVMEIALKACETIEKAQRKVLEERWIKV